MTTSELKKDINYLCRLHSSSIGKQNLNHTIRIVQLSKFMKQKLTKLQTVIVLLILLIFQFSLYDFDIKEYTNNRPNIDIYK